MRVLVLTKRQYTNKDLIDDRYGRLYELPQELARLGHQVAGLTLSYRPQKEGHLLGPDIDDTMVDWYSINLGSLIIPGLIRYLKKLEGLCSEFRPDIIFACSDAPQVIHGFRVARKLNIPCVVDLYDNFESFKLTRLPGVLSLFKRAVSQANGIVCISANLQRYIEKHYQPKGLIRTIPNGVPSKLFHPMDQRKCREKLGLPVDVRLVGTAGSIGPSRGIAALFDGYRELTATDSSVHLVLAGPLEPGTLLPKGEKIHYLGNLDYQDIVVLFNALDIGVICNLDTSFGRYCFPQKACEMLACGIPVVAAQVGVMAEMLKGHSGVLFSPGDYQSLARAVKKQLENLDCIQLAVPTWHELAINLELFLKSLLAVRFYNEKPKT